MMISKEEMKEFIGDDANFVYALNLLFQEHGARLYIHKPEYVYLELGRYSFYFHGDVKREKITTMGGETIERTILPYDGWEVACEECREN